MNVRISPSATPSASCVYCGVSKVVVDEHSTLILHWKAERTRVSFLLEEYVSYEIDEDGAVT